MIELNLANKEGSNNTLHYQFHHVGGERKIRFYGDERYAIVLPITAYHDGSGYVAYNNQSKTIKESERLSALDIPHQIIDTEDKNYLISTNLAGVRRLLVSRN